jgi:glycosyltransferase involved in cell wall biosynthesis
MKEPTITVLVTVKNSSRTIKKCIESLLKLNYKNYKIYVIDAFSNDGTYEILKSFGKKIILEQLYGNPPTAYNHALKKLKTDLTAFTNADCTVDKNWLRELVKGFEENTPAVAGIALNPKKSENKLQRIIGEELENRYNNFSHEIIRAPDMNLCLRTSIARKVRFNEKLDVSYDADFGYRMTSIYGKIVYNPKAIVYHYHRATWKKYFKQQFTYAKFVPLVYFKHKNRMLGDHISKPSMPLNIINLYLVFFFLILSPISNLFLQVFIVLLIFFFASFIFEFNSFIENRYFFYYLSIFIIRTLAWCIGLPIGIIKYLRFKDSL